MKKMETLDWIMLGVVLLTFVPGLLFYSRLPAQIPIHWGLGGVTNRFAPKLAGILFAPVVSLFLFFYTRLSWQPAKNNGVLARVILPIGFLGLQIWLVWQALP